MTTITGYRFPPRRGGGFRGMTFAAPFCESPPAPHPPFLRKLRNLRTEPFNRLRKQGTVPETGDSHL